MRGFGVLLACMFFAGCGINEVTIEVKGGDGNLLRLDANDVEFKFNRLVEAGSFNFKEIKRGSYTVNVVAGSYLDSRTLVVESAPISGSQEYKITFDIPAGANTPTQRQGTIIYASTPLNVRSWDIFAAQADGSGKVQLTHTDALEQLPVWSPDGKQILFTRGSVMNNIDLYVMNEDGSGERRLTEHAERDQQATWSPDGNQIAFVSQRDGDVAIWIMDIDGGNKRKLVKGREPNWGPGGKLLSFVSSQFEGQDELYTIGADGENMVRLTQDKRSDWFPNWSSNADRIVFCSERFGGQELMLMNAAATIKTRITIYEKGYEEAPVWSPDDKGVAYSGRPEGDEDYDIFLTSINGFNLDEVENPVARPINLTDDDDRDDKSPSWRNY
jgi:Tol biopolymer transport system component